MYTIVSADLASPASPAQPVSFLDEDELDYEGTDNVYDDFETLELIHPTLELGPHKEEIRQELETYEPQWLREIEKKFLTGHEKTYQYEEKMNMQLIIAHDQLHVQHKEISCSVYNKYQSAEIDWLITAIELWAAAHVKEEYHFNEDDDTVTYQISKESPIFKYRIIEWPYYLASPIHTRRPIPSLQDLCRHTIQSTLGTSQEFQLYKILLLKNL